MELDELSGRTTGGRRTSGRTSRPRPLRSLRRTSGRARPRSPRTRCGRGTQALRHYIAFPLFIPPSPPCFRRRLCLCPPTPPGARRPLRPHGPHLPRPDRRRRRSLAGRCLPPAGHHPAAGFGRLQGCCVHLPAAAAAPPGGTDGRSCAAAALALLLLLPRRIVRLGGEERIASRPG